MDTPLYLVLRKDGNYQKYFGELISILFGPQRKTMYVSPDMSTKRGLKSAYASTQSDQSLRCPHEETLLPWHSRGLIGISPGRINFRVPFLKFSDVAVHLTGLYSYLYITKTRVFKYTENFTTKKKKNR